MLRAWAYVLRDETGKFYAKYRPLFILACQNAGKMITEADYPDQWDRRKARAQFVIDEVAGTLMADMKKSMTEIPARLIFAAIEAAVAEIKGGWTK